MSSNVKSKTRNRKLHAIYEPMGRAREYAALAVNLYEGCGHGCRYCFAPAMLHRSVEMFRASARVRETVREHLAADVEALADDDREILLCFACDPYHQGDTSFTRECLEIIGEGGLRATVLTKGGHRAVRDFDLLKRYGFSFGTSLQFVDDMTRERWEPHAATVDDRFHAIRFAVAMGIGTWVSVEPVLEPDQALAVLDRLDEVDFVRIGKLNHMPEIEREINWTEFLEKALDVMLGQRRMEVGDGTRFWRRGFYIKRDLAMYRK